MVSSSASSTYEMPAAGLNLVFGYFEVISNEENESVDPQMLAMITVVLEMKLSKSL